ncbi:energy-coupling factor transporter transmembrane protein EcfT [Desulfobaculum xiamenense]|uniref:Energy-coupling factor transporter transmembrane protein EcfT n=1 Tax=Desulfobaculum xiamenense TaxID=995050 RepID=A0A846QJA7_9BACT|nr:energy-coupling factor transporter transmembrane component T [Desulfobaculum xiamenense]NJB66562.1 energy-coupling factor transporter transmembrane protein EcfT [Desulfobaculum xiamenense]
MHMPNSSGASIPFLRRLNPFTKLALFTAITINVFLLDGLPTLCAVLAVLVAMVPAAHPPRNVVRALIAVMLFSLPWTALIFGLSGWNHPDGHLTGFLFGLERMAEYMLRIACLLTANLILIFSTPLRDMTAALRAAGIPDKAVLFLTTIVRFVPLSLQEAKRILDMQRCRGFRARRLVNPANLLPIVVPLFISHLKKASDMSLTLEIRHFAWNRCEHRPRQRLAVLDAAGIAGAVILLLVPLIPMNLLTH